MGSRGTRNGWYVRTAKIEVLIVSCLWKQLQYYVISFDVQAEINYLGQLRHPNLVKLIGYCLEDDHRLLVYEFMPKGSMENHLFRSKFSHTYSIIVLLFFTLF